MMLDRATPPFGKVFRGLSLTQDDLRQSIRRIAEQTLVLVAEAKTLDGTFAILDAPASKRACEQIALLAEDIERHSKLISGLASNMARTFATNLNRKAHV